MNYNIFDLNYNKSLTRIDSTPQENQEIQNIFTNKIPSGLVGSLSNGNTLEDLGSAAWEEVEDIQIEDIINDRIDTQEAQILAEWTFGDSGAIKISPDDIGGVWISPDGIIGRDSNGDATVTIPTDGSGPTFKGTVVTGSVVTGQIIAESGSEMDWSYIENVSITNADIDSLSVTKLTGGEISIGIGLLSDGFLRSTNYNAGVEGWEIDGDGNVEFAEGTFRGIISGAEIESSTFHAIGGDIGNVDSGEILLYSNESDYDSGTPAGSLLAHTFSGPDRYAVLLGTDGVVIGDDSTSTNLYVQDGQVEIDGDLDMRNNEIHSVGKLKIPVGSNLYN